MVDLKEFKPLPRPVGNKMVVQPVQIKRDAGLIDLEPAYGRGDGANGTINAEILAMGPEVSDYYYLGMIVHYHQAAALAIACGMTMSVIDADAVLCTEEPEDVEIVRGREDIQIEVKKPLDLKVH